MNKNHYIPNILLTSSDLDSTFNQENQATRSLIFTSTYLTYLSGKYQNWVALVSNKQTKCLKLFSKTVNKYIKELHSWIGTKMSLKNQACYL